MNETSPPRDVLTELLALADAYEALFGVRPPIGLIGPSEAFIAQTVRDAICSGKPIPPDFDWYSWLPDGAAA